MSPMVAIFAHTRQQTAKALPFNYSIEKVALSCYVLLVLEPYVPQVCHEVPPPYQYTKRPSAAPHLAR